MKPLDIRSVKFTIEANLPQVWEPVEAVLSTIGAAMLKDVDHCVGLILVGEPGGRKSTTLELLGSDTPIIRIYKFSPASFVSHNAARKPEQLAKIDLLPQIRHKVMVIPELAPLFGQRYEDLVSDMAIFTAVMDGKGYSSSSGVHGMRGYEGDYRFNMVAATTPLERRAWQALGKLSSRWIFYRLPEASTEYKSLAQDFIASKDTSKLFVGTFIKDFWKGYAVVNWNRLGDDEALGKQLNQSAVSISRWRGLVPRQEYGTGYNPPIIEAPDRLRETLYALARGHALLYGRQQLTQDDVDFIIRINETNMPEDRLRVFVAFKEAYQNYVARGGKPENVFTEGITITEAAKAIGCHPDKANSVMNELIDLRVVRKGKDSVTTPTSRGDMYYRIL
jgi:hypothetical protein